MEKVRTVAEIKEIVNECRKGGKTIGLVPTMGYFHEGHLSLMREAGKNSDIQIVSIFVNPSQFGPGEDYKRYPRDLERDEKLAEAEGVDFLFVPEVPEMYPPGYSTFVEVDGLSDGMCGRSRPGHFRGVATVVTKLFNLIRPDVAYFGQKDAQQAVIIKRMVADLNMDTEIKVLPVVREKDGLAMSSRNEYLSSEERKSATVLYRALLKGRDEIIAGEKSVSEIKKKVSEIIESEKPARIDYVAIVDPETLNEKLTVDGPALIAVAVWIGKTRLIDNIVVANSA